MTHTYEGDGGSNEVRVDGLELDPRLDLANHNSMGFCWGYRGSRPTQLALAIWAHHLKWKTPNDVDHSLVVWFRNHWLTAIRPEESWTLTSDDLRALFTLRTRGAL